jgi:hypothetical protein
LELLRWSVEGGPSGFIDFATGPGLVIFGFGGARSPVEGPAIFLSSSENPKTVPKAIPAMLDPVFEFAVGIRSHDQAEEGLRRTPPLD